MEFPPDVMNRVRAALEEYRFAKTLNGRRRTWQWVAEELFDDFLSDTPLDDSKDAIKALAEALRRFAAGTQVLSDERRAAVRAFLLHKRFLTEADFESAPGIAPLILQLRGFLHADESLDRSAASLLAGNYIAMRKARGSRYEVSVLTISPADGSAAVEERVHVFAAPPTTLTKEGVKLYVKATGAGTARHSGALLGTRDGQICLLTRDNALPAASICLLLHREGDPGGNDTRHMLILKSGDFGAAQPQRGAQGIRTVLDTDEDKDGIGAFVMNSLWRYNRSEER